MLELGRKLVLGLLSVGRIPLLWWIAGKRWFVGFGLSNLFVVLSQRLLERWSWACQLLSQFLLQEIFGRGCFAGD